MTLLLSALVALAPAHAGSTYQRNLASVRAVQVEIRLVGPELSEVPGLDLADLRSKIRHEAQEILNQHEIAVLSRSGQRFYILAYAKEISTTEGRQYAVAIESKLDEEAALERYSPELDGGRISWVTTWRKTGLFVTRAESLAEMVLEDISFFLESFASDVGAARSYSTKPAPQGTGER